MITVTPEAFIAELDRAGIEWCLVSSKTLEDTAKFVQRWPDRTRGIVNLNPFDSMQAVHTLEWAVKELGHLRFLCLAFRLENQSE